MKNKVIDVELFMSKMEIERVTSNEKVENISYETNVKYYIDDIEDERLVVKVRCDVGFKPELMFKGKFEYVIVAEFEEGIKKKEVHENIKDIVEPLGSELSCLIANITKSMGGSPLIVPPIINKISKVKSEK